jgi:hypothetical protein
MKESWQKVVLKPFSAENVPDNFRINVFHVKGGTVLKIIFELNAGLADLNIPIFKPAIAQRKDNLWEHTCFEIFLGQHGMQDYREFNLSPAGDWNVYSFSGYRQGIKPEMHFNTLPFDVEIVSDQELKLAVTIDLKILQDYSVIDVGLSAVLEQVNGVITWWAIDHQEDVPDFHAKEGWLKSL